MNKELNEDARTKQDLLYECSSLESKLSNEIIKNENLEQQCKKQKEAIDRILSETKETRNILNNNRDDNMLSKSCLLSYLEIVENLLKRLKESGE